MVSVLASACGSVEEIASTLEGLPLWNLEEELRIGSVADADSMGFSSVTALEAGPDGSIYVLDWQSQSVRVFDTGGAFLRRIGRQGAGPGEFQNASVLGVVGDTLWVREVGIQRITLFTTAGELLGTFSAPEGAEVSPPGEARVLAYPARLRADGRFEATYTFPGTFALGGSAPTYGDSVQIREVVFEWGGAAHETGRRLTLYPPSTVTLTGGMAPLTVPAGSFGVGDTPLRFGEADTPLLLRRPARGHPRNAHVTLVREAAISGVATERSYLVDAVPITGVMADSIIELGSGRVNATGWSTEQFRAALRNSLDLPDFLPPVTQARLGTDGSIWLRREDHHADHWRWAVLDPHGEPWGEVRLPRGVTPHRFDRDHLWAVVPDDLDVPFLVRYRIVRDPAGQ